MRIAKDPVAPISSQVMGTPALDSPMTIFPSLYQPKYNSASISEKSRKFSLIAYLSLISGKSLDKAKTAIHSEATAISKPVCKVFPVSVAACPVVISLRYRSLVSTTRCLWLSKNQVSNRIEQRILRKSVPCNLSRINI